MKVSVKQIGGAWRLIDEATGAIAVSTKNNKPLDGGGHDSQEKATRQAGYINKSAERK